MALTVLLYVSLSLAGQIAQAVPKPKGKLNSRNAIEKFPGMLVLHSVHVGPLKGGRGEGDVGGNIPRPAI